MARESSSRSLIGLITELPAQITGLIKAEVEQVKVKAIHIGKNVGLGVALLAVALIFIFFAVGTLVAVAILALALVMPAWLAALIVMVVFLVIAAVFAVLGLRYFKKIGDEEGPVSGISKDIRAVKGTGEYDR